MDSPDTPTDMPRDPDVRLPENILPIPRNTLRLGIRAITQATLTVLVQVLFYALTIICILVLVSFLVECSGWLRETKRRHEEQKVSRPPRASSKAPRMPRHSDGSQCRSKPTQELKGRKPRLGVKSELQSQDQFDQFGFQAVGDVASSQPEDNVFYHGPAILRTPDPQPAPHSSRAPILRARTPIKDVPTTPSSDGKGQWLSPESIVGCTTVVPLKWGQIAPGDWVLRIRPPQTILKGTSDEADVYDGPWEVLKVEERHRVQHTPMVRKSPSETSKLANSSKASAKLSIPADSLLHKFSQGWVELGQLVKVDASIGQAVTGGFRSSFRGEDGEEYYQVKKVRGVKHEISKVPRTSGNSRSGPVTSIAVPETKKYLVHWAGYPSEDDTWELAQKDQTGGVPVEYICEWREREKDWKEARKAELVRDYYFDV